MRSAPLGFLVEAFLHFKKAVVFLGIGHELPFLIPIDVFFIHQEPDELLFFDFKLFGRFPETGEQVAGNELVKIRCFRLHDGILYGEDGVLG